jgi:hypothetical protein
VPTVSPSTPSAVPQADASPAPSLGPTTAELAKAIDFRLVFGLRADEAWIRAIAADPRAQDGERIYGVPLLPAEVEDMLARSREADQIAPIIRAYGMLDPLSWGGLIIDQRAGGIVVAQFTADVEVHRDRLTRLLPPDSTFDVREVGWSLVELRRFMNEVNGEDDWFSTAGISYHTVSLDELNNRVAVEIDSVDPGDTTRVAEHFGNPGWLSVEWGPAPWTGPRGNLVIVVEDERGNRVRRAYCMYQALDPLARETEGEVSTEESGRCVIRDVPAARYDIWIRRTGDGDAWITLARFETTVPADATRRLRAVVK